VLRKPISRSHRATDPSHENTGFLRALLDTIREGVAVLSRGGAILYANPCFAELIGVSTERAGGASLKEVVSPASREPLEDALSRALQTPTTGEMNIETHSGDARTIKVLLTPIRFAGEIAIGVTATDITEIVKKEQALRNSEASVHSLSGRILRLQDQERRVIARDWHDITGQELAFVVMTLSHLANTVDWPDAKAQQSLSDTVEIVRKIEEEVRTLSYVLHPPLLDEFGLSSALHWFVEGFTKRSGIEVQIDCAKNLPRLSSEKEMTLFRVVQESLTNVLRHSGSYKARILVSLASGRVTLSVQDEGHDIDRERLAKMTSAHLDTGVGIAGMRERLEQQGGRLDIHASDKGTEVVASLPVVEGEAAAVDSQDLIAAAGLRHEPAAADAKLSGNRKRILIVDDHEVTRRGIRSLLDEETDLEICGEARDGFEALHKTKELNPDLVV
jgi:two-component system, NarL family, sensor kinase